MQRLYPLCLLLLAGMAQAQDYRPFRPGLTYQYSEAATPGDTTHTLRLEPGTRAGADSVFRFNRMARQVSRAASPCNANYQLRPDNLFGATLTVKPGAEYVLTAANGRSVSLRPRQPLGLPWLALSPGVSAVVTARTAATAFGQPDSVASILLSNGATLQLSKRHGLLSGPALLAYLDGRYRPRQLTATAAPALVSGLGAQAIYDYQPGDVFLRQHRSVYDGTRLCSESWQRDSIVSRALSRGGDSIVYRIQTRSLQRGYGIPGAPAGYCSTAPGVFLSLPQTYTLEIGTNIIGTGLHLATGEFQTGFVPFGGGVLSLGVSRHPSRFNNRLEHGFITRSACLPAPGDSLYLREVLDFTTRSRYAPGLGRTRSASGDYINGREDITELVYYRKGNESWGLNRTFAQLLPATPAKAASSTSAAPNPFSGELTVRFELDRPQAVALELRDTLGRVVLRRPAVALAAGPRELQLGTAGLRPGLYTLWLQPAQGRVQALKMVKTE